MKIAALAASAVAILAIAAPARADDHVTWRTIVGLIQPGNAVDGIGGGGQPWSTLGGEASVDLRTGEVEFEVRGLVLAGGNSVGTPGAITSVMATIACGTGAVAFGPSVPLSAQGDAHFEGTITPPPGCSAANLAFLVSIPGNRWIANGAVRRP
ncbi:MAG TPA: hypothetical protein VJR47_08385 [Stellaceae bacterium]|nr:hypothetical protein [Stellaceae bacterium]